MTLANRAVIDIGSNAIRYVAYGGAPRGPVPVYNEKAQVSLGRGLAKDGKLDKSDMAEALDALDRFAALARMMEVETVHQVATAAVREAKNGIDFIGDAAERGHEVRLLSGDEEAFAAGMGVLCDAPWAEGYVADLGGGSLEIVRVSGGKLGNRVSIPFGTLRLAEMTAKGGDLGEALRAALKRFDIERGLHIYLVGGAWRALMRLAQHHACYPLDILANYAVSPDAVSGLIKATRDEAGIKALKIVPAARVLFLHDAAALTQELVALFKADLLVASVYGIREGLLYEALPKAERAGDPLLACTRDEGRRLSRFAIDGDAIDDWIAPLFESADARLRKAACNLADSAWSQHPDHRAEHAAALGLNGSWLGIDGRGRAILSRTLCAIYGGKPERTMAADSLAEPEALAMAHRWGLAIRLAMRLDGGTGAALAKTRLTRGGEGVKLDLSAVPELASEAVERRVKQLGLALG